VRKVEREGPDNGWPPCDGASLAAVLEFTLIPTRKGLCLPLRAATTGDAQCDDARSLPTPRNTGPMS
jgi:hypothetical protein